MINLDELEKLAKAAIPGPWTITRDHSGFPYDIRAPAKEDTAMIFQVRGWGYFTGKGHGALGLPQDEAQARMNANANHVAACSPDNILALIASHRALVAVLEYYVGQFCEFSGNEVCGKVPGACSGCIAKAALSRLEAPEVE